MANEQFALSTSHIKLLQRANVGWQDAETGAPEIDPKRPYGNSDVARDVAEILKWKFDEDDGLTEDQEAEALKVHAETEKALQIMLVCYPAKPGMYVLKDEYDDASWVKKPAKKKRK